MSDRIPFVKCDCQMRLSNAIASIAIAADRGVGSLATNVGSY